MLALGLIGVLFLGIGFLMIAMVSFAETVILPQIADTDPGYVNDVLATLVGDPVRGDVGGLALANGVASITYLFGGLVFGIALYRAGIVARWAALLLSIGALASLLAGVLPDSIFRTKSYWRPGRIRTKGARAPGTDQCGLIAWLRRSSTLSCSVPSGSGAVVDRPRGGQGTHCPHEQLLRRLRTAKCAGTRDTAGRIRFEIRRKFSY